MSKTIKVLVVSVAVYVSLFLMASVVYFLYVFRMDPSSIFNNMAEATSLVLYFGVLGSFSLGSGPIYVLSFPLAPFVLVFLPILATAFLFRNKLESKWKLVLLVCIIPVLVYVIFFVFDSIRTSKMQQARMEKTVAEIKKYEFADTPEITTQFIYARGLPNNKGKEIVKSGIFGQDIKVLRTLPADFRASYFSPLAGYYINLKNGKILNAAKMSDDSIVLPDLCTHNDYYDKQSCPQKCNWSNDEKYLACQYSFYGKDQKAHLVLDVFSLASGQNVNIYDKDPYEVDYSEEEEGFSWHDNLDVLYFDKGAKIFQTDEYRGDFSQGDGKGSAKELSNLFGCSNIVQSNGKIFCAVNAERLGLPVQDPERAKSLSGELYVISQEIGSQNNPPYAIINDISLGSVNGIIPLDSRYVLILPSGGPDIIIDTKTKRIREMAGSYDDLRYNEENEKFIFDANLYQYEIPSIAK